MKDFFEQCESLETSAKLNVASGLKMFVKSISKLDFVKQFIESSSEDYKCKNQLMFIDKQILSRVAWICSQDINLKYEHPYDIALSIYVFVANELKLISRQKIVDLIYTCDNCFWAKRIGGKQDE